ncbi:MAG TPA: peptide-methionine (R)-S-oxide reductase MsrB [Candidatus Limnocylindrales bacterium]|nr:peptide-methionine (R)-S-oxide reductase MsrB [Candidatus Limnocylindrales bacterium]
MNDMKDKPEEYWKEKLTPEQYRVLREKGTEAPFSGKYTENNEAGVYKCAACGAMLFTTDAQHESKTPGLTGWPSFSEIAESGSVELVEDNSMGMNRIEAICANCGGHLGHVFEGVNDTPTGKHYCINSCALDFTKK